MIRMTVNLLASRRRIGALARDGNTSGPIVRTGLLAPAPLYQQIKDRLIQALQEGEWEPGSALPSEPKLAARYGVSVATIRAAIGSLVAARVLARKQGKGTFVSLHEERHSIYQFFHVVRNDGVKDLPKSEILSFRKATADDDIADLLRLPRGRRPPAVYRIRNVLKVSGIPVVLSDITIPCSFLPGLTETILREGGETLYAVYQMHFGINIVRTTERLRAVNADAAASAVFGLAADEPLLQVQRVAYTFNDVPVEVRRSRVDTRNYFYLFDQAGTDG